MAKHCLSSGRRPCRPLWAKERPNSHESFTCVAGDFLNVERMKATILPAGTPAATIETPDGLILAPMVPEGIFVGFASNGSNDVVLKPTFQRGS